MASSPLFPLLLSGGPSRRRRLARILRELRLLRGLRPGDLAQRMGLAQRSLEHLLGGEGRINLERLEGFAEAADVDGFAILVALWIGSPDFAVRAADNKLVTILLLALADFEEAVGDDIARLEPRVLIAVFERAFTELAFQARRRDPFVEEWLSRRSRSPEDDPQPE